MKYIPGCKCCAPTVCGTICVTASGCNSSPLPGAVVTVSQSGTTIGSATATGQVTQVNRTATGTGYTGIPTVTISGDGTGATAVANMSNTNIASVALVPGGGGSGYTSPPTATIGGSIHGSGTTLTARLGPTSVGALTLGAGGNGYTDGIGYALTFSGGAGSGAAGTFDVVSGAITNLQLTSGGSGYTTPPTIGFSGAGSGVGASAASKLTPGPVTGLTLGFPGNGYQVGDAPTVVFAGGGGTGAGATATLGKFSVSSFTVTAFGSGYSTATVAVSGGGGTGAAASALVRVRACVSIPAAGTYTVVTAAPSGYHLAPNTQNVTASCTTTTLLVTLLPIAGYHCQPCCVDPWPGTLHGTSSLGNFDLVHNGSDWYGCISAPGYGTESSDGLCTPMSGDSAFSVTIRGNVCNYRIGYSANCCSDGGPVEWSVISCPVAETGAAYVDWTITCFPLVISMPTHPQTFHGFVQTTWTCGPADFPLGAMTFTP